MKSVLISIQPKWCELISSGKKTIEVRKTAPKEVPFKAYIYETKGKKKYWSQPMPIPYYEGKGKVIGEFVCDETICCQAYYGASGLKHLTNIFNNELQQTCLTEYELFDYIVGKDKVGTGWLWHISELKIYDEPRELSEFSRYGYIKIEHKGNGYVFCDNTQCEYSESGEVIAGLYRPPVCRKDGCKITRAPQSWCYVEEQL